MASKKRSARVVDTTLEPNQNEHLEDAEDQPVAMIVSEEAAPAEAPTAEAKSEDLVVFAFRLTKPERDLIHQAAGKGGASRVIRGVAIRWAYKELGWSAGSAEAAAQCG